MPPTVYLISGANRGLGLGFVNELTRRDNVLVFAGVRDFSSATALHELSGKRPGKIHILKLTSCDKAEHAAAVAHIRDVAGRLDVVIANAAISTNYETCLDTTPQQMRDHFEINAVGPLVLFQSTWALLHSSTPCPRFILISSTGGSVSIGTEYTNLPAYGASKAAANYLTRKLHFEHEGLISFAICPGGVITDMGTSAIAKDPSIEGKFRWKTPEETALAVLRLVDNASRDEDGGRFYSWDGSQVPW